MAAEMGALSGYAHAQSSYDEIHVGNQMDWLYATYGVLSFTFEMGDAFAMPDEAISTETARNMEAAYYAIEQAASRPELRSSRRRSSCPTRRWVPLARRSGTQRGKPDDPQPRRR